MSRPLATEPEPLLAGTDLHYRRGGRSLLTGVSVAVRAGDVLAVLGPSGSGKSSLLSVLSGLVAPDAGEVALSGRPLGRDPLALRRRLGLVLQGYGLVPVLTAAENVEIVLQARGLARREARRRAAAMLSAVELTGVADNLVERLSGGQQQRVAVARALVTEPDVVLADEPTAELDPASQEVVLRLLFGVAEAGGALVLATHDPALADRCGRRLRLREGLLQDVSDAGGRPAGSAAVRLAPAGDRSPAGAEPGPSAPRDGSGPPAPGGPEKPAEPTHDAGGTAPPPEPPPSPWARPAR